jgi:hypothetical protein
MLRKPRWQGADDLLSQQESDIAVVRLEHELALVRGGTRESVALVQALNRSGEDAA